MTMLSAVILTLKLLIHVMVPAFCSPTALLFNPAETQIELELFHTCEVRVVKMMLQLRIRNLSLLF